MEIHIFLRAFLVVNNVDVRNQEVRGDRASSSRSTSQPVTEHLAPTCGVSSAEDENFTVGMAVSKSRLEASLRTAMSFLIVFASNSECCVTLATLTSFPPESCRFEPARILRRSADNSSTQ